MRISIVIPVYNVEAYIEDCLHSVTAQTYIGDIECIIVDDCTPDRSCIIIEKFISEHIGNIEFKLLHHKKNRGLSAARNTGIDAATGEYIFFLDSDDEITPDCIELLTTPLKNKRYDFVIGDYKTIGSDNEFPPLLLDEGEIPTNNEIRTEYFKNNWYMMAWNKLCNLDFIRNKGLYFKEGLINEDNLWSFQLACMAQTMFTIKNNTYNYKIRPYSIMGNIDSTTTAIAFSTISYESYNWCKKNGLLFDRAVFNKIQEYRFEALYNIFHQNRKEKRYSLFNKCFADLQIEALNMYKHKLLTFTSLIRELYNYTPPILGYWYLLLYRKVCKSRF